MTEDLIVISRSKIHKEEPELITRLFVAGLQVFHLRKPEASKERIEWFLNQIPQKYLNRVVLHTNHQLAPKYGLRGIHLTSKHRKKKLKAWFLVQYLKAKHPTLTVSTSFHSLNNLTKNGELYEYAFLSPVFDSISKSKYRGKFEGINIKNLDQRVMALGGINEGNIEQVREMGFSGAALLGAVWTSEDPVSTFTKIKQKWESSDMVSA